MADAAQRLISAATELFAELGYAGTSIRAIAEAAETNVNAVSYHFGGKQALYQEILSRFGAGQLDSAERILGARPKDADDLETRLSLFAGEVLATYKAEPDLAKILLVEFQQGFRHCAGDEVQKTLAAPSVILVEFLVRAKKRGLLRKSVDPSFVAGTLLERVSNQVLYADNIQSFYGESVASEKYTRRWLRQLIDLLLYGAAREPKHED